MSTIACYSYVSISTDYLLLIKYTLNVGKDSNLAAPQVFPICKSIHTQLSAPESNWNTSVLVAYSTLPYPISEAYHILHFIRRPFRFSETSFPKISLRINSNPTPLPIRLRGQSIQVPNSQVSHGISMHLCLGFPVSHTLYMTRLIKRKVFHTPCY